MDNAYIQKASLLRETLDLAQPVSDRMRMTPLMAQVGGRVDGSILPNIVLPIDQAVGYLRDFESDVNGNFGRSPSRLNLVGRIRTHKANERGQEVLDKFLDDTLQRINGLAQSAYDGNLDDAMRMYSTVTMLGEPKPGNYEEVVQPAVSAMEMAGMINEIQQANK